MSFNHHITVRFFFFYQRWLACQGTTFHKSPPPGKTFLYTKLLLHSQNLMVWNSLPLLLFLHFLHTVQFGGDCEVEAQPMGDSQVLPCIRDKKTEASSAIYVFYLLAWFDRSYYTIFSVPCQITFALFVCFWGTSGYSFLISMWGWDTELNMNM